MYLLKLLAAAYGNAPIYAVRHVPDGVEDALLRRSDHHPNVKGAELLGLPVVGFAGDDGGTGIGDSIADGAVLVAVGFDYEIPESLEKFFEKFSQVITIAARESVLTKMAHVCVPGLTFAEKDGLVVNFEGQLQELNPGLDGLWDKLSPWQVIAGLLAVLTGEDGFNDLTALRRALGENVAAFSAVDLNAVGALGQRV
jgi:NADH dehydrogenase/NADH:ubiquinone oxidoreductase subunit G